MRGDFPWLVLSGLVLMKADFIRQTAAKNSAYPMTPLGAPKGRRRRASYADGMIRKSAAQRIRGTGAVRGGDGDSGGVSLASSGQIREGDYA